MTPTTQSQKLYLKPITTSYTSSSTTQPHNHPLNQQLRFTTPQRTQPRIPTQQLQPPIVPQQLRTPVTQRPRSTSSSQRNPPLSLSPFGSIFGAYLEARSGSGARK
ncbi:hypothetical protein EJ08DRAFT_646672 [Tothia fuscella]|uniref:Uncharacterized protein n=1 Tax=Tothia fuscella TaxID=1048955 RepID=A0A9P4NYS6_9PEZI|nr:hypothetical protein EJ08DRAFT_646672 [Tothia fuscella]